MTDSAVHIKDLLVTAGVGIFESQVGWGIFIGGTPTRPDTAIAVTSSGGQNPNPKWLLDFPSVQTLIRGAPNGYAAARAKAADVKDALLGLPSQDIGGDRMVAINLISDIAQLGFDEKNRVELSLNWSLIVEPASSVLTNRLPL